ncbi:unnamed protein product, partial [Polarella glacialis]
AQQLCRALIVGEFDQEFHRVCGWWALLLQYGMALCVLFVSQSVVLGAQTCVNCFMKIFSVFVIVDMDNLAARFLEGLFHLDFEVKVNIDRVLAIRRKGGLVGGLSVRIIFLLIPVMIICMTGVVSVYFNTLPLTLLKFGRVENRDPPKMLIDSEGGCCPPSLEIQHSGPTGMSANCSVLLLAMMPPRGSATPPRVHWVALEAASTPKTPSSFQVLEGRDADNNPAAFSGSADSAKTEANFWLQTHKYASRVYYQMLKREQLYKRTIPFQASFFLDGLEATDTHYVVFVTAQNPDSRALAERPAQSAELLTSSCAPFCENCDLRGPRMCDEGRCMPGTHYHAGRCFPCTSNCEVCELNEMQSDADAIPCDYGGCTAGFGKKDGECLPCEATGCQDCDAELSRCTLCKAGLGLDVNGTCQECAAPHCRCFSYGGCEECEEGWGPAGNGTCAECKTGCKSCRFSDKECTDCLPGYVLGNWMCEGCMLHCTNCSANGINSCDECRPGFSFNPQIGQCSECKVEHCKKCSGEEQGKCSECEKGFGLTEGGLCEACGLFCARCGSISDCSVCQAGYVAVKGRCWGCADRCSSCDVAGYARCDLCLDGFLLQNQTCTPTATRKNEMYSNAPAALPKKPSWKR